MVETQFEGKIKLSYMRKKGRENRYTYYIIRIPQTSVEVLGGLQRNQNVHVIIRTIAK